METEIEIKFCDIDKIAVQKTLAKLGATQVHPEILMKREALDFSDKSLGKDGGWVRVRDEGKAITLSYKQLLDRSLHGTKEIMVEVNDYDKTLELLHAIGLKTKSQQKTLREKWQYHECEITIDTWPWIPPLAEIEGPSEEAVRKAAADLGFDWKEGLHGSVENVYTKYYDVTEEEVCSWQQINFSEKPPKI